MLDQRMKKEHVETPAAIVERLGLAKTTGDTGVIAVAVEAAINENPKALEDYRKGESRALNFLVGQEEVAKLKAHFTEKDAEEHKGQKDYKARFRIEKLNDVYMAIIEQYDPKG